MDALALARDHQVRLVHVFAAHLAANPDADVHAGLCALVGHVQGDELDKGERELLNALTRDVLGTFAPLDA